MSYANRRQMSSNRTAAIVVVALIHIVLGYAIVTGLAYNVVKEKLEDLKTFDVEEPPPPDEPPPPPEDTPLPPPPQVSAPPPLVNLNTTPPPIQTTPVIQPVVPVTPIVAPPAPPAPPAPRVVQPKSLVGSLQGLIRSDDYPESAIQNDEQGTVRVVLTVGPNGRVSDCTIAASSGSRTLDSTTCRILRSRAKYEPAQDSAGNPVASKTSPQTIRWVLQ